jgi:hypothetical protein
MKIRRIFFLIFLSTFQLIVSCSTQKKSLADGKMFVLNEEMAGMLLSKTGTVSISSINESVYKKTTEYEIVGVDAELNRHQDAKGESLMHVKVAFIRYNKSEKIEMHDVVQPMYMLQQQTWKETVEQLKAFE